MTCFHIVVKVPEVRCLADCDIESASGNIPVKQALFNDFSRLIAYFGRFSAGSIYAGYVAGCV